MKLKLDQSFITDNTLECEKDCYFLKTAQNMNFASDALEKGVKIIDVEECKKLLKIDENIKTR